MSDIKESNRIFGNRLKTIREELGFSQEELARKMGYKSRSSINKIEMGINGASASTVMKLSEITGVPITRFMGWAEEEQKEHLIPEHRDEVEKIVLEMMSDFTPQQFDVLIQLNSRERDQVVAFAQGLIASRKD